MVALGLVLLGLALGAGCVPAPAPAPQPGTQPRQDQAAKLLSLGDQQLMQGRPRQASDAYRAALRMSRDLRGQARALLGLARADKALGLAPAALEWLDRLFKQAPAPDILVDAHLLAASLELELGRHGQSAVRLRGLLGRPPQPLSPTQVTEARSLLAKALAGQGQYGEATAVWLQLALETQPPVPDALLNNLMESAGRTSSRELTPLVARATNPQVRAALQMGLVQALLSQGSLEQARELIAQLGQQALPPAWREKLRGLDSRFSQARTVAPRAVGVILPLSGQYARFGRQVLAAVELGLGLYGQAASPPTLYIEDSASKPAQAAQAVDRLVQQRKVMAIIGPMSAATSLAAARRAQQLGVPLITLTQVEGVTRSGEFVFQNFYTPSEQVAAVLDEAINRRGLTRIAIMAPDNTYGKGFTQLIRQGVAARGGELVRAIAYPVNQQDYTNQVKELVRLPPGNYRPGHPGSPTPVIDFQALFMPDGPERVGMIASQLAYLDVVGVTLLGTSLWHNDKLLTIAGRYVEGCLFPDAFTTLSKNPQVAGFVADFRQALGQDPNVVDAQSYDAALVVRVILDSPQPPRTRQEFRQALANISGVEGVCGKLLMGVDRRLRKQLELFTVKGGDFKPLSQLEIPAPATTWPAGQGTGTTASDAMPPAPAIQPPAGVSGPGAPAPPQENRPLLSPGQPGLFPPMPPRQPPPAPPAATILR